MEGTVCTGVGLLGVVSSRFTMMTDISLWGWGEMLMGKTANGVWSQQMVRFHINTLEMHTVFWHSDIFYLTCMDVMCW